MNNDVDDLIKEIDEWINQLAVAGRIRRENPYSLYLIGILYPHKNGLPRRQVINEMWRRRGAKGLNMPKAFGEAVQSAFQHHAGEYAAFQQRGAQESDDLFFAPKGLGARPAWWAVRQDRADVWLAAKKKEVQAT